MTGFTASLMVLKLVSSMEGFATGRTAKAVGSGKVALAVTDHGLWVGEGLAAERAYRVGATHQAGHATRRHPLGQQSLQHTPTMLVLTTATKTLYAFTTKTHAPLPDNNHAAFLCTPSLYFIFYNNQPIDSVAARVTATGATYN